MIFKMAVLTLKSDIQQRYQSLLGQTFKRNSGHIPFLNLISKLYFEPRFRMFIINGYYTKTKRVKSLDSLFYLEFISHNVHFQI